jgi:C-terminal processing protease CtpA/Prc
MQYQYKFYKKSLLLISSLIFSLSIQANECAAVKILPANVQGQSVVYELVGHNGAFAEGHNKHSQFTAVLDGSKEYYLTPGVHSLIFDQWDKRQYRLSKRNSRKSFDSVHSISKKNFLTSSIQMNVEKNKRYNVAAKSFGKDNQPIFSIVSIEDISSELCDNDKVTYIASGIPQEIQLSNNLDYKLKHLMAKMETVKKNNFTPLEFNWSFGAVFDTNKNSFKTLAVFPYSFASKLKLTSGDEVLEINGMDVKDITKDPYKVLYGLLGDLGLGHDVNMTILRAGKEYQLSHQYLPAIVPNVNYKIEAFNTIKSLTNSAPLPEDIRFQYNNIMVEIAEYAKQNNFDKNLITIKSPKKYDVDFGLTGKNTTSGNKSAFIVMRITANSPAENVNLQQGDMIIAINGEELTGSPSVILSSKIKALIINKIYSLSIIRDGVSHILSGEYSPILFPKFEVTLDLAERNLALNSLFDLTNNPTEFNKERKLRYNYGIELNDYNSSTLRTPRSHRSNASFSSTSNTNSDSNKSSDN